MALFHVTENNFQKEVLESDQPVLLDFWAEWCMPCRMMGQILEETVKEHPELKIGKVNVDEERALAEQFRVMSIPTLVVMDKGKIRTSVVGVRPKEQIVAMLK